MHLAGQETALFMTARPPPACSLQLAKAIHGLSICLRGICLKGERKSSANFVDGKFFVMVIVNDFLFLTKTRQ